MVGVYHAWTKHIEVHYHYVREKVLDGELELAYVSIDEQVADIFTKALGKVLFEYFRRDWENMRWILQAWR
ncbi:Ty1/Copia family ribonuclease HI, partial [Escherichia coli]|uniref:Ty1/Copia family ribonuclease HI n=1 Tax=Escherichia coli TaxID=562 RepID=UPI0025764B24